MKQELLTVSTSPHIMGRMSLNSMHAEWLVAMLPAILTGMYYFGVPALTTVLLSVASCVATELIADRISGKPSQISDLHAVVLGVILGLLLPPVAPSSEMTCPWWLPIVGGMLTIALGKTIFGGLGGYPMHPVIIAWAALALSWPEHMNAFLEPGGWSTTADEWAVAATPLMGLKDDVGNFEVVEVASLWLGAYPGAVGITGTWSLLIGGAYLVIRRIIPWQIPLGVLAGAAIMGLVAAYTDPRILELGYEEFAQNWNIVLFHLGAGGLMISAFFLAPEPVTSPVTPWGMFLFGLGVGFMAIIVRTWGGLVDGAFYGVLLMNAVTPLFDRIRPKVLGKVMSGA